MAFRKIDSRSAWLGETAGLAEFRDVFLNDCAGSRETFRAAYGWTEEAFQTALRRCGLQDR